MIDRITKNERKDLLIAWIVISAGFGFVFARNANSIESGVVYIFASFLTVGVGFIFHEMAHKFTAIHYGFWAEFKKDNTMLALSFIMAITLGIIFAAPGAAYIYATYISREQNGKISAAGPFTNLMLCIPFAILLAIGFFITNDILKLIGFMGVQVNAMLAAFNMIPFSILDGKKVYDWSKPTWLVLASLAVAILIMSVVVQVL